MEISPIRILFHFVMSSRRLQDVSSRHLQDMSTRRLQDVFSVIIFCLPRRLQDVFKTYLQDVLKTSWKTKNYYAEDVLKTSARRVLKTSSRLLKDQQMFVGIIHAFFNKIERKAPIHVDKSSKYAIKGELTIIFGS